MIPLIAACAALAAGSPAQQTVVLAPGAFSSDLKPWYKHGDADAAADETETREGRRSARITIKPGIELRWQQLRFEWGADVREGDEFASGAWVRTRGVEDGTGAYIALEFVGTAPAGATMVRLSLVFNSHGTAWFSEPRIERLSRMAPWPDLGSAVRDITVREGDVIQPKFGGVGFHAFHHEFPASQADMDEVIYKRWRELSPSFVRVNHNIAWDKAKLDRAAVHFEQMKRTGTLIYIATWDPKPTKTDAERAAYAREVVDHLEYWVRTKGLTNIRWYCMTNELSLEQWGKLANDLPTFKAYHQAIYEELKRRKLDIGLLATDASPVMFWPTLKWAADNMDDITAIYGAHHYINDYPLEDERFYPWFLGQNEWAVKVAKAKGKDFVLGEFGAKQDGRTINGIMQDRCVYYETPQEPMSALQVAEAAVAAINAGVYGLGYWTYMDLPDDYAKGYINKWGTFRCSGADRSTRAIYFAYALLTRCFRGQGAVVRVECGDPRLRVAAIKRTSDGAWSIAVINRNRTSTPIRLKVGDPGAVYREYVFDATAPPTDQFGDLPGPAARVKAKSGVVTATIRPLSLTVFTTAFDETPPPPVTGVKTVRDGGSDRVTWAASKAADLCYYRIFRGGKVVGTTIAATITIAAGGGACTVSAVDQSGNASTPR